MNEQVALVFTSFLWILIVCVFARSLLSWFPISPNHPLVAALNQVTEPLLEPVRRFMPKNMMIDFSGMIVVFALIAMVRLVNAAAGQ